MANLYELMLGDATDQSRMQMAADALRRREALGTLAAFTGDKYLQPWGQGQLEDVATKTGKLMTARQQGQQVAEQRESRLQRARVKAADRALREQQLRQQAEQARFPRTLGGGYYSVGDELRQVPGYAEQQDLAHQRALELAAARASDRPSLEERLEEYRQKRLIASEIPTSTQAGVARETLTYLPRLESLARALDDPNVDIEPEWEVPADWVRSVPGVGGAAAAGLERMGMTPESIDWLAKGRQMESDIIRLASGLAVTGFELENIKKWSPFAANLTPRERQARMSNVYNKLRAEAAAKGNRPEFLEMPDADFTIRITGEPESVEPNGGWTVEEVP